jgi:hypothetical protein
MGAEILLIMVAYVLTAISPLFLIFSVFIAGFGLVAPFFSFDRALVVLKHY